MKWEKHLEYFEAYLHAHTKVTSKNSIEKYLSSVVLMLRWIGKSNPQKITQKDVEKYNVYMVNNYKQNSRIPHVVGINHFLKYLGKDIALPIPSKVKVEKTPLTKHEIEKMLSCAKDTNTFDYVLLSTVRDTIQREHAIRDLDIDDVRLTERKIRFKSTKGGKPLIVNITPRTASALRDYIANHRIEAKDNSKALFVLPSTGSSKGNRISKTALYDRVKKYAIMAGISKNVSPHLFRHSGISIMDKGGVSPSVIKAQSGHRDMKTLMGYCHPDEEHKRREFDRTLGNVDNNSVEPSKNLKERNIKQTEPESVGNHTNNTESPESILTKALVNKEMTPQEYEKALAILMKNRGQSDNIGYIR